MDYGFDTANKSSKEASRLYMKNNSEFSFGIKNLTSSDNTAAKGLPSPGYSEKGIKSNQNFSALAPSDFTKPFEMSEYSDNYDKKVYKIREESTHFHGLYSVKSDFESMDSYKFDYKFDVMTPEKSSLSRYFIDHEDVESVKKNFMEDDVMRFECNPEKKEPKGSLEFTRSVDLKVEKSNLGAKKYPVKLSQKFQILNTTLDNFATFPLKFVDLRLHGFKKGSSKKRAKRRLNYEQFSYPSYREDNVFEQLLKRRREKEAEISRLRMLDHKNLQVDYVRSVERVIETKEISTKNEVKNIELGTTHFTGNDCSSNGVSSINHEVVSRTNETVRTAIDIAGEKILSSSDEGKIKKNFSEDLRNSGNLKKNKSKLSSDGSEGESSGQGANDLTDEDFEEIVRRIQIFESKATELSSLRKRIIKNLDVCEIHEEPHLREVLKTVEADITRIENTIQKLVDYTRLRLKEKEKKKKARISNRTEPDSVEVGTISSRDSSFQGINKRIHKLILSDERESTKDSAKDSITSCINKIKGKMKTQMRHLDIKMGQLERYTNTFEITERDLNSTKENLSDYANVPSRVSLRDGRPVVPLLSLNIANAKYPKSDGQGLSYRVIKRSSPRNSNYASEKHFMKAKFRKKKSNCFIDSERNSKRSPRRKSDLKERNAKKRRIARSKKRSNSKNFLELSFRKRNSSMSNADLRKRNQKLEYVEKIERAYGLQPRKTKKTNKKEKRRAIY